MIPCGWWKRKKNFFYARNCGDTVPASESPREGQPSRLGTGTPTFFGSYLRVAAASAALRGGGGGGYNAGVSPGGLESHG
jgi:hypothetical protein